MTVTLLTLQTLTGCSTAITTLLPYPHPQSPQNVIVSARITKVVLGSPGEQLLHLLHTSYTPLPRPSSVPSGIFVQPAVWPQQTWAEN